MVNKNASLGAAKVGKQDEFYTQLEDIEQELSHYRDYFRDKVVFCNCDDPYESDFFKYFALYFNALGLKKLIATCYDGSPIAQQELPLFPDESNKPKKKAYKVEISEVPDLDGNGATDLTDVKLLLQSSDHNVIKELKGNGDFRSPECVELLKQADVVVTNPPFSLFREYIALLLKYNKKFLVIGNQNAITYKEIFKNMQDNELWLGYKSGDMAFRVPNYYEPRETRYWVDEKGQKWRSMGNICWFTNLDIQKRHEELILVKKYSPDDYPKFDNYDAINVNKTDDIPADYSGIMGVPITFLDKYNPDQFELLGITQRNDDPYKIKKYSTLEYPNANDLNARGVLIVNGKPKSIYARILIRNKNPRIA